MLPPAHRLTDPGAFRAAGRRGARGTSRTVVVHVLDQGAAPAAVGQAVDEASPRVGFVVSKAVGGAVVRNRVKRRLRHLVREQLDGTPSGCVVVVRALPAAAQASHGQLGRDLHRAWSRALEARGARRPAS
ncbi:ribonuclease P protein component [Nocardioides nanhaiensis]|uniref:Ribonuclease P protein component n=1 Tax=Nocardioides nanhaiensis TaxID=1476871 RepID=A0ABP8WHC6_9ACTN